VIPQSPSIRDRHFEPVESVPWFGMTRPGAWADSVLIDVVSEFT